LNPKTESLPRFLTSAAKLSQCPPEIAREIAFIGRSNVGKSSLLGALIQKPDLVRSSRTPGRTQLINYFETKENDIYVDLPGYGFAEMPGKVKVQLDEMIQSYLQYRNQCALVLLLLDGRRDEPSPLDIAHFEFARQHGKRVLGVVTKVDRVGKAQRKPLYKKLATALGILPEDMLAVSSNEGDGVVELKKRLFVESKA